MELEQHKKNREFIIGWINDLNLKYCSNLFSCTNAFGSFCGSSNARIRLISGVAAILH